MKSLLKLSTVPYIAQCLAPFDSWWPVAQFFVLLLCMLAKNSEMLSLFEFEFNASLACL